MISTQKKSFIFTLFLPGVCFLILSVCNIVNATTVVSLYGDKDGFGIGQLPGPISDVDVGRMMTNSDPTDPLYTDLWMWDTKSWTHTYSISGLGTITSASLEVFYGGLGFNGASAPIYIGVDQFIGNLPPGETPGIYPSNVARLVTLDLMPFASYLNGSTTFTIGTMWADGWVLDYSQLTIQGQAVPEPATMLLLGSGLIGLAGYGRKKFFKK